MISPFERFVALRYLLRAQGRAEGRRFVRFITYMAIGGVAIGVTALLLALAIVRGFSQEIRGKIISFGAHVQVESFDGDPLADAEYYASELQTFEGVVDVLPVIQEFALLRRSAREIDGVSFRGVERPSPALEERLIEGAFDFARSEDGLTGVVIGAKLARLLDLSVGDKVVAFSMRRNNASGSLLGARPLSKQFYVSGIYETSFANFDELFVFTDIEAVRKLFEYGSDEVTRFELLLEHTDLVDSVSLAIEDRIGFPLYTRTVFQTFRQYFAWVNLQESIIPLVIGVIILVGAFNIIGTLLMILLEKTPEIGVLSSMGASPKTIRRLFLWLGLLIGGVGVIAGQILALGLAYLQQQYELIPLPEEAYYMKVAPISLSPLDFILVGAVALALCALAAYFPARAASRIAPIRAIRFR